MPIYNLRRVSTSTTGTGTITLGSAVTGFKAFTDTPAIPDQTVVQYAIADTSNSEIGQGVYTVSGSTLTRNVTESTNSNNPINLSGVAQVFITPSAGDLTGGVANATWFGASTSGTGSANAAAIQAALNTGLDVYIPGGTYSVTSLTMNTTGQHLYGDGTGSSGGTVLTMSPGSGDGLTVGNASTYTTGMRVSNIQLNLSAASGGNAINCKKLKYFIASNVIIVSPQSGVLITSANVATFQDLQVLTVATGASNYAFKAVGTDADPINVLNIYRFTCSPTNTGVSNRAMGIIIDGAVDTTDLVGIGCARMGRGLWVVNTGGATNLPSFIQTHSFQADFPELEGMRYEVGAGFFNQNYYVHGSETLDGVYTASGVDDTSFGTGECTGNSNNGFNINGTGTVIVGSTIARNSASGSNTYDGIAFGSAAVGAIVTGNQIGEYNGTTGLQRYGVSIDPSATNIGLGINNYNGNVTGPFTGTGSPTATMSRYACAGFGSEYILAASAAASSHTGDTNETTLATITVPANALGANGYVVIESLWTVTNSANNKIVRTKFGATTMMSATFTTQATYNNLVRISNRNATNSQVSSTTTVGAGGWGQSTSATNTAAIDTTASVSVTLTGQLANTGETITLESYVARLYYQA